MSEITPENLGDRLRTGGDDFLVVDIRHEEEYDDCHIPGGVNVDVYDERNEDLGRDREEFVRELASDVPAHPPNFERVKRTNVGRESVPADELADLELGPNNCAAE